MGTLPSLHPLIETHRAELLQLARRRGVVGVRVFGSMSRDDGEDNSDVDLLVTLVPGTSALPLVGLLNPFHTSTARCCCRHLRQVHPGLQHGIACDIIGDMIRAVLDTDVVVAALRSPFGGSAEVLRRARVGSLRLLASVALVLEYEAVATRPEQLRAIGMSRRQVLAVLTDIVAIAEEVESHFVWRPQLHDPDDELVLDVAINGRAEHLVSFNRRDFGAAPARFGVRLSTPAELLRSLQI